MSLKYALKGFVFSRLATRAVHATPRKPFRNISYLLTLIFCDREYLHSHSVPIVLESVKSPLLCVRDEWTFRGCRLSRIAERILQVD